MATKTHYTDIAAINTLNPEPRGIAAIITLNPEPRRTNILRHCGNQDQAAEGSVRHDATPLGVRSLGFRFRQPLNPKATDMTLIIYSPNPRRCPPSAALAILQGLGCI